MLAQVRGAATLCARIEDLWLGRRFDARLLASHLINTPDEAARQSLLMSARRHLADAERVLVEWHPPQWFETAAHGQHGWLGEVEIGLHDVVHDGDLLSATVRYSTGDGRWEQSFTCQRLDETRLKSALAAAGLTFDGWCSPDHGWFAARPKAPH
jgi:hypothetical protein